MEQERLGRRPRQARSIRTRAAIIDAALRLWVARGYGAVTVDDICAEAGIAKGAFYFHYPSKTDLIVEVATPDAEDAERALDEALMRRAPIDAMLLTELASALAESCRDTPRALVRHGVAELVAGFDAGSSRAPDEAGPRGIRRLFTRFYRAAIEQGRLPDVYHAEELASMTSWAVLQGAMLWGAGFYARWTLATVLRRAALLIWQGAEHADPSLLASPAEEPSGYSPRA